MSTHQRTSENRHNQTAFFFYDSFQSDQLAPYEPASVFLLVDEFTKAFEYFFIF